MGMKTINDLITNQSFINWVNRSNEEDIKKWETWIKSNTEKKKIVSEAALIVKGLTFNKKETPSREVAEHWELLNSRIDKEVFHRGVQSRNHQLAIYRFAAIFLGLLFVASVLYYTFQKSTMYEFKTAYGQKATIELPDGSEVVLNGNSTLSYPKDWTKGSSRQVWLKGEAYFQVRELILGNGAHQKFQVFTDDLLITVLGTAFNVNTHGRDLVALEKGKVKLNINESKDTVSVILSPGELGLISEEGQLTKEQIDPYRYAAWKDNKVIFENTPLIEIIELLQYNYGLQVELEDKTLTQRKLSGELTVTHCNDILQVVEKSLNLKVTKVDNQVRIGEY